MQKETALKHPVALVFNAAFGLGLLLSAGILALL